eukprot:scaffold11372_cov107-Isochrysis_galbana.AAC.3
MSHSAVFTVCPVLAIGEVGVRPAVVARARPNFLSALERAGVTAQARDRRRLWRRLWRGPRRGRRRRKRTRLPLFRHDAQTATGLSPGRPEAGRTAIMVGMAAGLRPLIQAFAYALDSQFVH